MTQSVIPILLSNGIEAISVGVNGGSAPPNVPKAFIWRNSATNQSIRTFYLQGGYSGFHLPTTFTAVTPVPGSDSVMVVLWRGDNAGPPPLVSDVESDWASLQKQV